MGFGGTEAANLTALSKGVGITAQPWTIQELAHVLFLQELCAGRQWSGDEDRAVTGALAPASAVVASDPAVDDSGGAVPGVRWMRDEDADRLDGRITLLTMFRAVTGREAVQHVFGPLGPSRSDATGDVPGEGR